MIKTYSNRQNTIRAARAEMGKSAKVGVDFTLETIDGRFSFAPIAKAPEPATTEAPAPKPAPAAVQKASRSRGDSKAAQLVARARSAEGITNREIKLLTGWSKLGGFFGAVKRSGLVLTRKREGDDTRWFAAEQSAA